MTKLPKNKGKRPQFSKMEMAIMQGAIALRYGGKGPEEMAKILIKRSPIYLGKNLISSHH